jgi:hypothetical protein
VTVLEIESRMEMIEEERVYGDDVVNDDTTLFFYE